MNPRASQQAAAPPAPSGETQPEFRWVIAGLLFLATFINYIDRQTFAIATPELAKIYKLSNDDIANIILGFTLAYTVGQVLAGKLIDTMGTRGGFALIMLVWSLAGALTATARSVAGFVFWRVVLGLGEAGNWPACIKAVAEWFTPRQRALGNAIFSAGSSLGAILAPPVIGLMIIRWGWQSAFLVAGASGLLWLFLWFPLYRPGPAAVAVAPAEKPKGEFLRLLGYRQVWGLILVRFFTDPVWWFFIAWLPKYMADERGFGMRDIATRLWIPYLTSAFGGFASGWVTSALIRRGWEPNRARKTVMTAAGLLMLAGAWVASVPSAMAALWLVSVSVFGFYAFAVNTHAIVADLFPTRLVASVSGISAVGAGVGSIIFTKVVGIVADRYSFAPVFVIAGLMPLVALFALLVVMGKVRRVEGIS